MRRQAILTLALALTLCGLTAENAGAVAKTSLGISTTPSGAEVFLVNNDGETSLGFTPITKVRVPRGTITLRIELDGYEELLEPIDVGKRAQNLVFNLVRKVKPGELTIRTSPQFKGAKLKVNGKILGELPQKLTLKPGRHQAVVYLKGHKKWIRWLDVAEGQSLMFEITLEPKAAKRGAMMVASSPSGAIVRVNQKERGKTPLALDDLEADNYFVEIEKDGFMLWKKAIKVEPGKRAIVDAVLEPKATPKAMLKVDVDIPNAEIYLNERLVGVSPSITLEVEPGNHDIKINPQPVGGNYETKTKSLRIEPGKTLEVAFRYKTQPTPSTANGEPKSKPAAITEGADTEKQAPSRDKAAEQPKKEPQPSASKEPLEKAEESPPKPTVQDAKDEAKAHNGRPLPSTSVALGVGDGALALHAGYPYFAGFKASVGLRQDLDLSLAFRTIGHLMNEFEVSAKMQLLRTGSFALGAEAGIGFGLGADERNSFLMSLRGLASLLLGSEAGLTAHVGFHFFSDRNGPEAQAVHADRTNVLQVLLGLTLELGISKDWTLSMRFEGDPIGGSSCDGVGRCLYQLDILDDALMYGGIAFTRTF